MARPTLFRHRKFARLSRLLGSEPLALGHLELLWSTSYESGEELIGDSADVEYSAKWSGDPGKLTEALTQCGFIDATEKGFIVHDLWDHAPEYVRKRRARELERRTTGAKLRQTADNIQSMSSHLPVKRKRSKVPPPATCPEEDFDYQNWKAGKL